MKYYALYDLQINGFKAGIADTNKRRVIEDGANRAYNLSQNDEEPIPDNWSNSKILRMYGYEVREVSKTTYDKIVKSDAIGLLTKVDI